MSFPVSRPLVSLSPPRTVPIFFFSLPVLCNEVTPFHSTSPRDTRVPLNNNNSPLPLGRRDIILFLCKYREREPSRKNAGMNGFRSSIRDYFATVPFSALRSPVSFYDTHTSLCRIYSIWGRSISSSRWTRTGSALEFPRAGSASIASRWVSGSFRLALSDHIRM